MNKFDVDWSGLDGHLNKKPEAACLSFAQHGHQFRKIALDVYEKYGETGLWELRESEDGSKVLVALYEEAPEQVKQASVWAATPDSAGQNITLSYKNKPIYRFASDRFNFTPAEAGKFASFVAGRASNPEFVDKLVSDLSDSKREFVKKILSR